MLTVAGALVLTACSRGRDESDQLSKRVVQPGEPVPKGGGRYKVGSPYKIGGRWYTPRENPGYDHVGVASWYGELFHGRYTANGEIFDMNALTAAHTTLPLPSYVRVTNLRNNRSLVLRVNDRGPYAHDRIIDLSRRSAHALGFARQGTARVRVQYMGPAPLDGDDSLERRVYASQPWAQHASLDAPADKSGSRTRLARADRGAVRADPMVVGAIPKGEDASQKRPSGGDKPVFIQAASYRERGTADILREKLADLGTARVVPADVRGQTYYRVRLGPFAERHDADVALRAAVGMGATDALIVKN